MSFSRLAWKSLFLAVGACGFIGMLRWGGAFSPVPVGHDGISGFLEALQRAMLGQVSAASLEDGSAFRADASALETSPDKSKPAIQSYPPRTPQTRGDTWPAPKPGTRLSQRVANYHIEAQLFPEDRRLEGMEVITWTNQSRKAIRELQLHLYWNAFQNELSSFMLERDNSFYRFTAEALDPDDFGYIRLTSIRVYGRDLLGDLEYIAPDDGNPFDQTVARIPLPRAIPRGKSAQIEITWEARVPKAQARAGVVEDFFFLGQWFPKLGVLEYPDKGGAQSTAWNCHQYHARSEFFADFGTYDVQLTVPEAYVIGASGQEVSRERHEDGTVTVHQQVADVHDFAWTAWPDFAVFEEQFEAPGLPPVRLKLLFSPEAIDSVETILQAARDGLTYYGEAWFPYPYESLTIVAPPYQADRIAGMEYPTFFTTSFDLNPAPQPFRVRATTLHELGHQYWGGMLASNEFEEAWLDEGINQYGTALVLEQTNTVIRPVFQPLPGLPLAFGRLQIRGFDVARASIIGPFSTPIRASAWHNLDGGDYSRNNYGRVAATLRTLEGFLGEEVMAEAMRLYARRWAFKHPSSDAFFEAVESVLGEDLDWFWAQFFEDTVTLDYAVTQVSSIPWKPAIGYFDADGKPTLVAERPKRPEESEAVDEASKQVVEGESDAQDDPDVGTLPAADGGNQAMVDPGGIIRLIALSEDRAGLPRHRNQVTVRRVGEAHFPVAVLMTFEDGTTRLERWDGKDRWRRYIIDTDSVLISATVDPGRVLLLDANRLNDGRTVAGDSLPSARLSGLLWTIEQLLLTFTTVMF